MLRNHLLVAALLCCVASASAYEPRLGNIVPQGGQRGTELTVMLYGARLGIEPQEVLFYEGGIEVKSLEGDKKNSVKAQFNILPECPLGRHALCVRTTHGVSKLMTFHVGVLAEAAEAEPNNHPGQAQAVPMDTTVNGIVQREDLDCYVVEAKEGERLSIEVEGIRMGRTFFDPTLELLDESGKVIAKCDDAPAVHQDAFLSIKAPKTGKYIVRVRESALRGDGNCVYRLHIGTFPRPRTVFPPTVVRGQESKLRWIGDALGEFEQSVNLDAADARSTAWPTDGQGVAPSPLPVVVVDKPPSLESEPNNKGDQASPAEFPGVAAGVIDKPGDRDHYRFEAKKGQVLDFRLVGRELRSPIDSIMWLDKEKGGRVASNDDDRGKPDSYFRVTIPEDGFYRLGVRERLNRGGEEYIYAVEAKSVEPAATLSIDERRRYEATLIEVPQGGSTSVLMTLNRRDVGGDMQVDFQGLPQGVTAEVFPLAGNYNRVPVVLHAAADAPLAGSLCPLVVKRTDGKADPRTDFAQQTWLSRGRNNRAMWSYYADRTPVVVTKPLPFKLRVEEPKAPLVQNGVKNLKIIAERAEGFDGSIRVYTLYNSPGVSSNRSRSIVKGKNEAIIPVTANGNARTGDWKMTVVGELNSGGRVYACTPYFTLPIAQAYFDMKVPSINTKQGEQVELTVEVAHRNAFEGDATLTLVRLPHGVTAETAKVNKESSSATFKLTIAADARPGRHRGLGCQATININGDPVTYTHGYSELRIDPRPATEATAQASAKKGGNS